MFLCRSGDVTSKLSESDDAAHIDFTSIRSAYMPRKFLWGQREELRVKFLSLIPEWTYGGDRIDLKNIIDWANVWHNMCSDCGGIIPKFVAVAADDDVVADIRIEFNTGDNLYPLPINS